ncbi:hypothetical protein RGE_18060 [Rubrivivax gelatinosus IL144]|uniref:Uncharacterized protein n=1 Tax=Rubrivivax gelatinosus (strain NBRC 100245 / IL144) TaxID=983917 RepID=I0HQ60_RUBGI|nr:hypothetical protein RGE_18060 [Rubrivivax gelatinosus IL144]
MLGVQASAPTFVGFAALNDAAPTYIADLPERPSRNTLDSLDRRIRAWRAARSAVRQATEGSFAAIAAGGGHWVNSRSLHQADLHRYERQCRGRRQTVRQPTPAASPPGRHWPSTTGPFSRDGLDSTQSSQPSLLFSYRLQFLIISENHFSIFVMAPLLERAKNTVNKLSIFYAAFVFIARNHEATSMMIINLIMQIFEKSKKLYRIKTL